jgi:hypothetical protein
VIVQPLPEPGRDIGPAPADIDAAQFEPRQQRDGIDLVLGEFLPHAPDAPVEQRQRLIEPVEVDQEEREMPPIVRVHEGVAVLPRIADRLEERHALDQPPARLEAMRQRVMRPRILALHLDRPAGLCLRLVEPIALLESEGVHPVDEMVVGVGVGEPAADPQQRLGVALVEGMELAELAGQQVARPFGDHLLVDREASVPVAGKPGLRRLDPGRLAGAGACQGLGPRQVFGPERVAVVRIHRQDEIGGHDRQQDAALVLVHRRHEAVEALAEDQPFLAQEVERLDGACIGIRDFQPLPVPHASGPRLPRFSLADLRTSWHGRAKRREEKPMKRRSILARSLAATALAVIPRLGRAQAWPDKPIRFIVPYAPGGSTDTSSRIVAEKLAPLLGQPLIVENKAGGGTIIGTEAVARAKPDGYTILLSPAALIANSSISRCCSPRRTTRRSSPSPSCWPTPGPIPAGRFPTPRPASAA